MKTPGPDHPITLTPATRRWRAMYSGHVIADSNEAIILAEAGYKQAIYFPRADVAMEYMSRTARTTNCPYKGDAAYYTVLMNGHIAENAVWTYEEPYPAMELIRDRLAFYPDKVELYEVDDAVVNPHHLREVDSPVHIDAAIQHTDAGGGAAQGDRWQPNVERPDDSGVR